MQTLLQQLKDLQVKNRFTRFPHSIEYYEISPELRDAMIAALEEKGQPVGMQWVKASERLPDRFYNVIARYKATQIPVDLQDVPRRHHEFIEWLDESQPQQYSKVNKCTKPDCACLEEAERLNGGQPVKNYACLAKSDSDFTKEKSKIPNKPGTHWLENLPVPEGGGLLQRLADKDKALSEFYDLQNPIRQGFMLAEEIVQKWCKEFYPLK